MGSRYHRKHGQLQRDSTPGFEHPCRLHLAIGSGRACGKRQRVEAACGDADSRAPL